jgi:hypothetical protein
VSTRTASPALSITSAQNFKVTFTATNTGGGAGNFYVAARAAGPATYDYSTALVSLNPAQSLQGEVDFRSGYYGLSGWPPGVYSITAYLLIETPTGYQVVDQVELPGELTVG